MGALVGGCSQSTGSSRESSTQAAARLVDNDLQTDFQTVIGNVLPSVVQIEAADAVGSGIVYDAKGHVVTNAHVVGEEKGQTYRVTTATGERPLTAKLVFALPEQDVAVIKLDKAPAGLQPAKFGDSSKVEIGQIVLAMGSPLGLSSSVTQGIVSAVGRTVSEGPQAEGPGTTIANMVQTSAAINPGNSGGALVNLDGEVIGIPTLAADPGMGDGPAPGIGFAVPASTVQAIADQIVRTGKVAHSGRAGLGVTGRTVLDDDYQPSGVAVVEVEEGGPADKAGLRAGDILTRLDEEEITTIASLAEALGVERPGARVEMGYLRAGVARAAQVRVGEV
ncbi:trypsin-like peptidase domain-containing protein [Streptomyces sp. NPDC051907]|uniref:S1C family serine protease n=1 Tax=Streptomyces sp. NPDC051907 TaxID=3155284 RepID=UPI0034279C42